MLEGRQVNVTSRLGGHQDTSGGCAQLVICLVCWERQSLSWAGKATKVCESRGRGPRDALLGSREPSSRPEVPHGCSSSPACCWSLHPIPSPCLCLWAWGYVVIAWWPSLVLSILCSATFRNFCRTKRLSRQHSQLGLAFTMALLEPLVLSAGAAPARGMISL